MSDTRARLPELVAIALLAFTVRLVFLIAAAPEKAAELGLSDPFYYHAQANLVADGQGFIEPFQYLFRGRDVPSATHPPAYVLVLAASSAFGGTSLFAHELIGCAIGVAAALLIAEVTRIIAGPRAGFVAGIIAALYPQFWLNDTTVRAETLFAFVVAAVVGLAYRFEARPTALLAGLLGLATGVAALTRGEGALLLVFLVAPLALRAQRRSLPDRLGLLALSLGVFAATLAPWTAHNLSAFERPVLLSNNVGEVIGGANCEPAYSGSHVGGWIIGCLAEDPPSGDESQRSATYRKRGIDFARGHLGELPKVVLARVARLWDVYAPSQNARANASEGRPLWAAQLSLAAYYVLLPLSAAGAVLLARRGTPFLPLGALVLLATVTAALSWGAVRFRIPAEVAMVVTGAVAIDALFDRFARRRQAEDSAGRTAHLRE